MSAKNDVLLKTYKSLAQIPALVKAKTVNNRVIASVWSQRNLEKGKSIKFKSLHLLNDCTKKYIRLPPVDVSNELLQADSTSHNISAIIREVEVKDQSSQFLEIWNDNNLIRSIDLTALDLHGKVYTDDEFASFEWSPSEAKLIYVAEKKVPERTPINKRIKPKKNQTDEEEIDILKGEEFRQDWGEQMVGKIQSVLVVYDYQKDDFDIPKLLENVCIAKPLWTKDGKSIVGISYFVEPRKLGLIYCANRASTLFTLSMDGNYEEFKKIEGKCVKSPLMTPDGENIVWFENKTGGPHQSCMKLCKTKLPLNSQNNIDVVIDEIAVSRQTNNGKLFYGIYSPSIPKRCWTKDQRILFSTVQKNAIVSYIVDLDDGSLNEIEYQEGSQLVLDVHEDVILVNRRHFFTQDGLYRAVVPPKNMEIIFAFEPVLEQTKILENKVFQNLSLSHNNEEEIKDFTAIFLGPEGQSNSSVPLILYPHGGPHSAFANNFSLEVSFLLNQGYAIVMVNYRGSIGAGQKSLEYLPGRVGQVDVTDCILAAEEALKMNPCLDKGRVSLLGGSHGGFLVTHLSGQYPDMFRAVIARNPVIDIATMSGSSDIPDWCYVESGTEYSQVGPISEPTLVSMRQKSPIIYAHKVKAATLLQIGLKDLRVPPSQGIDYYHRLKANNVIVSMNVYDDNHPLGSVPNEMGFVMSTIKWLEKYAN